jgi:aquaporin Z
MRQRCLAEATGTFCLVFAGTGAVVIDHVSGGAVSHVGVALTFGLIVLAMIFAVGDVSGAHINPAVTFGFVVARRFPLRCAGSYVVSQLIGALLASALLRLMFPSRPDLGATLPATSGFAGAMQSFVLEAVLSAILMLVILSIATGPKERGPMAAVAVGSVIALEALFAGPISGASMNPARSLAPALVSGELRALWVYLLAPPLGAAVAVPLARAIYGPCIVGSSKMSERKNVVFVCVENSNRSQMAEAFARMHGAEVVNAYSAGSRPSGVVNPKAIDAMRQRGYDLTAHRSKSLADLPDVEWSAAITMGCGDECPNLRAARREDWAIPDPKHLPPEQFADVRDLIERKVRALLRDLASCPHDPATND